MVKYELSNFLNFSTQLNDNFDKLLPECNFFLNVKWTIFELCNAKNKDFSRNLLEFSKIQ